MDSRQFHVTDGGMWYGSVGDQVEEEAREEGAYGLVMERILLDERCGEWWGFVSCK